MKELFRWFIKTNVSASSWFDKVLLPLSYRKDGNRDFIDNIVPEYLYESLKIYEVGGGKQPLLDTDTKKKLGAYVVGIDVSQHELDLAPESTYDETICADIASIKGQYDADLVICQAVLEHVKDTEGAIAAVASLLKPGGKALLFIPNRNAIFARINILLPEKIKKKILWTLYPESKEGQGFESYYSKCTPKDILLLSNKHGLYEVESRYYYMSNYFSFMFPLYVAWRIWICIAKVLCGGQMSETFSLVLVKNEKLQK